MREEILTIEKIQKSGKIALTITTIAKVVAIVAAVLTCLAGVLLIGVRNTVNAGFYKCVEEGILPREEIMTGFEGEMVSRLIQDGYIAETAGVYAITAGVIMICLAVVMHFIGKVFKEIKESYSPFTSNVLKNLKVSFVLITVLSLESSLLIGLVTGFSLWCVYRVFEYGCILQRQSDETL